MKIILAVALCFALLVCVQVPVTAQSGLAIKNDFANPTQFPIVVSVLESRGGKGKILYQLAYVRYKTGTETPATTRTISAWTDEARSSLTLQSRYRGRVNKDLIEIPISMDPKNGKFKILTLHVYDQR